MNRVASAALVTLYLVGAAVTVLTIPAIGAIRGGGKCGGVPGTTPRETLDRFLEHAVQRKHPDRSYALVTPALHQGKSCSEWARGTIPIVAFPDVGGVAWAGFSEGQDSRKIAAYVALTSRSGRSALFVLELTLGTDGLWRVSHWSPTAAGGAALPA